MGVSFTFCTVIGFEISRDQFFKEKETSLPSCSHKDKYPQHKHCPECGQEIGERKHTEELPLNITEKFFDDIYYDDNGNVAAAYCARWKEKLGDCDIEIVENLSNCSSTRFFVGYQISNSDRDDDSYEFVDMPSIPKESALASFLRFHKVPFAEMTWGIHKIVSAY